MKKIYIYIAITLANIGLISCSSDNESIIPADISNVGAVPGHGYIHLKWDMPEDRSTILYTEVTYFDHLKKIEAKRLSSVDTIRIPNTRNKFGEYTFNLETVSQSGNSSGNIHSISSISLKAPTTEKITPIKLNEEQLSTNAQEPTEGPIKNLIDGSSETYFVTRWSSPVPAAPHWIQVDLEQELTSFNFAYDPRKSSSYPPTNFDIIVSQDGDNWTLLKNFTKEDDELPTGTGSYKSPTIKSKLPFKHLRFSVNQTEQGTEFWTMSEFRIAEVIIVDPEAEVEIPTQEE